MVTKEEVQHLATLARLSVTEKEAGILAAQMTDILNYAQKVQEIASETTPLPEHRNIMREDGEPHEAGVYTKDLLNTAAQVKNNSITVPKIISND